MIQFNITIKYLNFHFLSFEYLLFSSSNFEIFFNEVKNNTFQNLCLILMKNLNNKIDDETKYLLYKTI